MINIHIHSFYHEKYTRESGLRERGNELTNPLIYFEYDRWLTMSYDTVITSIDRLLALNYCHPIVRTSKNELFWFRYGRDAINPAGQNMANLTAANLLLGKLKSNTYMHTRICMYICNISAGRRRTPRKPCLFGRKESANRSKWQVSRMTIDTFMVNLLHIPLNMELPNVKDLYFCYTVNETITSISR